MALAVLSKPPSSTTRRFLEPEEPTCVRSVGDMNLPWPKSFWQWQDDKGKWRPVPPPYHDAHEEAAQKGHFTLEYDVPYRNGTANYPYIIVLVTLTQTNMCTGTKRKLRRLVLQNPGDPPMRGMPALRSAYVVV